MILDYFFEIYAIFCISVILHEFAHVIVAWMIQLKVKSVHIGDDLFAIHMKKLYFSIVMLHGSYVGFESEELTRKKKYQIVLFFLSGVIVNALIVVFAKYYRWWNPLYMDFAYWINIYLLVSNVFPIIFKENDFGKMRIYLKESKKFQSQ